MSRKELIEEVASYEGILQGYHDVWGNYREASFETKEAVLSGLGYPVEDEKNLKELYVKRRLEELSSPLEPIYFLYEGRSGLVTIRLSSELLKQGTLRLKVLKDSEPLYERELDPEGLIQTGHVEFSGATFWLYQIELNPTLEIGYYRLELIQRDNLLSTALLAVTPSRAYLPEILKEKRLWGLGVNLFEINSRGNQGIGDLTDLRQLIEWTGKSLGGDFVAINPLHTTTNQYPYGISPYAPISRLYLNPIYIDLNSVDGVEIDLTMSKEIEEIKKGGFIDYEEVYRIKYTLLKRAFLRFYKEHYLNDTIRAKKFRDYIKGEGKNLQEFALFMSLFEHFSSLGLHRWQDWPSEYQSPLTSASEEFSRKNSKELLFHKFLQWLLDEELRAVNEQARNSGMAIGLYRDMAVGSLCSGMDVWANQDIFVHSCSVGAPPDTFSPLGQNWGFPPLSPSALRKTAYAFFIELIRKNMRHAGALRIDHALGLFRLFWIPDGFKAEKGVYVRYPVEELLRLISLESVREKTLIIAEDLGTVPQELRQLLHKQGMLSFRLLYFEKDHSTGEYLPPQSYPEMAIVSTTTHDLPTLYGFWAGRDIEVKEQLDRYPDEESLERDRRERQYDRWRLLRALSREGLLPEGIGLDPSETPFMKESLCRAIYRYLAKTPCLLLMINLNDLLGIYEQTNLPGTLTEYPNWQRRHPLRLEDIMKRPFEWLKQLRNSQRPIS
ncbi:MAG: 4-alpha-glucanotransferase [Nitrospirae bacterium]|nr:MAG: 4-alpha-glucanotransferase [Nitrospirota bacterium]